MFAVISWTFGRKWRVDDLVFGFIISASLAKGILLCCNPFSFQIYFSTSKFSSRLPGSPPRGSRGGLQSGSFPPSPFQLELSILHQQLFLFRWKRKQRIELFKGLLILNIWGEKSNQALSVITTVNPNAPIGGVFITVAKKKEVWSYFSIIGGGNRCWKVGSK